MRDKIGRFYQFISWNDTEEENKFMFCDWANLSSPSFIKFTIMNYIVGNFPFPLHTM